MALFIPDESCLVFSLKTFSLDVKTKQAIIWDQCCHLELMNPHSKIYPLDKINFVLVFSIKENF